MTAIAESLSISTSTVIRKLKEFKFKTDLSSFQLTCLGMSMASRKVR